MWLDTFFLSFFSPIAQIFKFYKICENVTPAVFAGVLVVGRKICNASANSRPTACTFYGAVISFTENFVGIYRALYSHNFSFWTKGYFCGCNSVDHFYPKCCIRSRVFLNSTDLVYSSQNYLCNSSGFVDLESQETETKITREITSRADIVGFSTLVVRAELPSGTLPSKSTESRAGVLWKMYRNVWFGWRVVCVDRVLLSLVAWVIFRWISCGLGEVRSP